jgi:SagB-type dehydrogenase family enzyme
LIRIRFPEVILSQTYLPPAFGEQNVDVDDIAEIFHENTKYWPSNLAAATVNVVGFLHAPGLIERTTRGYNHLPLNRRVELASHVRTDLSFEQVMRARQSTRAYCDEPVTLETLSGVLDLACRATRIGDTSTGNKLYFRPYPSGGGLYPIEIYVVALNVSGIAPSVSHYNARAHRLEIVREEMAPGLFRSALTDQKENENAALAIVLTSVLQRSTAKYGPRGYRFALMEAGHCAQNLCLAAAAGDIQSCLCGGYFDDKLAALCGADGVNESVASVLFMGKAASGGADGESGKL